MLVSVIIPTYNREKCIIDLLQCLFEQDYPKYEIIVVDQSELLSNDKEELIKSHQELLKYYHISERGRSLAKNYGLTFSQGEIIIFCDDDIIVPTNFISTHVKTLSTNNIAAASCRLVEEGQPEVKVTVPLRTTFYGRLINIPYSTQSGFITSLNGGNMSFKKSVLNEVGYFEEFFEGTSMVEEPDIAYRIIKSGHKIYFNASITIFHYPQYNGNIAEMKEKRASWFYFYFFNLCIFYLKYNRFINIFFVFIYCIALSLKHTIQYRMNLKDYVKMISGFFLGMNRGLEIRLMKKKSDYFTPIRSEKKNYKPIQN